MPNIVKPRFLVSVLGVGVLFLTGCKIESDVDLFVSDVFRISETGQQGMTPARIRIEAGSSSQCDDNKEMAGEVISRHFSLKESPVCLTEGFDDYLAFRTDVPIMVLPEESGFALPGNAPMALGLKPLENNSVEVYGLLSPSRLKKLEADFKELSPAASLEINSIQITLTNDDQSSHKVFGPASWVNDAPNWGPVVQFERRDRITWRASDVGVAFFASKNFVWLMTIEQ